MIVLNKTNFSMSVEIVKADNSKDSVFLMAKGKVTLPDGASLEPTKLGEYRLTLKTNPPIPNEEPA